MSDVADFAGEAQALHDADLAERLERERLARESQPGTEECIECGDPIPPRRREAMPWVTRCVPCQEFEDHKGRRRR